MFYRSQEKPLKPGAPGKVFDRPWIISGNRKKWKEVYSKGMGMEWSSKHWILTQLYQARLDSITFLTTWFLGAGEVYFSFMITGFVTFLTPWVRQFDILPTIRLCQIAQPPRHIVGNHREDGKATQSQVWEQSHWEAQQYP